MVFLVLARAVSCGGTADDDLAVVKRAVAQSSPAAADPGAPGRPSAAASRGGSRSGSWRRPGKKVTINLPLTLVRALGDDWPAHRVPQGAESA